MLLVCSVLCCYSPLAQSSRHKYPSHVGGGHAQLLQLDICLQPAPYYDEPIRLSATNYVKYKIYTIYYNACKVKFEIA